MTPIACPTIFPPPSSCHIYGSSGILKKVKYTDLFGSHFETKDEYTGNAFFTGTDILNPLVKAPHIVLKAKKPRPSYGIIQAEHDTLSVVDSNFDFTWDKLDFSSEDFTKYQDLREIPQDLYSDLKLAWDELLSSFQNFTKYQDFREIPQNPYLGLSDNAISFLRRLEVDPVEAEEDLVESNDVIVPHVLDKCNHLHFIDPDFSYSILKTYTVSDFLHPEQHQDFQDWGFNPSTCSTVEDPYPTNSYDNSYFAQAGIPEFSTATQAGADSLEIYQAQAFNFRSLSFESYYFLFPKIGSGEFDNPFSVNFLENLPMYSSSLPTIDSYQKMSGDDYNYKEFQKNPYSLLELLDQQVQCIENCTKEEVETPPGTGRCPEGKSCTGVSSPDIPEKPDDEDEDEGDIVISPGIQCHESNSCTTLSPPEEPEDEENIIEPPQNQQCHEDKTCTALGSSDTSKTSEAVPEGEFGILTIIIVALFFLFRLKKRKLSQFKQK
ncbi:MAG: hypothetical protein AAGG51_07330 [Cyanobacteria bacterium P01_G01_bin.54]